MSSGCMPKKEDRKAVIRNAIKQLKAALKILEKHKGDPDAAPREIEQAAARIGCAKGCEYGDQDVYEFEQYEWDYGMPTRLKGRGLEYLMEHYFS